MGMVSVAEDVPAQDALSKLRRYAMAHDDTVDRIAAGVIRRRISVSQLTRGDPMTSAGVRRPTAAESSG